MNTYTLDTDEDTLFHPGNKPAMLLSPIQQQGHQRSERLSKLSRLHSGQAAQVGPSAGRMGMASQGPVGTKLQEPDSHSITKIQEYIS